MVVIQAVDFVSGVCEECGLAHQNRPKRVHVYCSVMQDDPVRYWQDLTENYRQMSDGELLSLAEKPEDLTDIAQQVLGDEMKKRKLSEPKAEPMPPAGAKNQADIRWEPSSYRYEFPDDHPEDGDAPREYTWKTKLCDCETRMQALQLAAALQRAGIDSWIQGPRGTSSAFDLTFPRILVAADQLEQAQAIATQPIPQDIIDELMEEEENRPQEFELPRCPKCGAPDPVLCPAEELKPGDPRRHDLDWVNMWLCEACGAEWADPQATNDDEPG